MKKTVLYCLALVCGLAICLPAPQVYSAMAPLKKVNGKSKSGSKAGQRAGRSNGKAQPRQRGRIDNKSSRGSASRAGSSRTSSSRPPGSPQRSRTRQAATGPRTPQSGSAQRAKAKRSSIVGGEAYRPVLSSVPKGPKSPTDTRTAKPGKSILKRPPTKARVGVPPRQTSPKLGIPKRAKPTDSQRMASRQQRSEQRKKRTLKKLKGSNNMAGTGQRTATRGTGPKPAANNAKLLAENAAKQTKGKRANPASKPGPSGLKRVDRPNTSIGNPGARTKPP